MNVTINAYKVFVNPDDGFTDCAEFLVPELTDPTLVAMGKKIARSLSQPPPPVSEDEFARNARCYVKCLELHDQGYRPGVTAPPKHDIVDDRELPWRVDQAAHPIPTDITDALFASLREVPLSDVDDALRNRSWCPGLRMRAYHPGGTPQAPTLVVAEYDAFAAFLPYIPTRLCRYLHPVPGNPQAGNFECTDFAGRAQACCESYGVSASARTLDEKAHHSYCWACLYKGKLPAGVNPKREDLRVYPFEPQAGVFIRSRNPADHYDGMVGASEVT